MVSALLFGFLLGQMFEQALWSLFLHLRGSTCQRPKRYEVGFFSGSGLWGLYQIILISSYAATGYLSIPIPRAPWDFLMFLVHVLVSVWCSYGMPIDIGVWEIITFSTGDPYKPCYFQDLWLGAWITGLVCWRRLHMLRLPSSDL